MKRNARCVLILLAVIVLVSCGNSNKNDQDTTPVTTPVSGTTDPGVYTFTVPDNGEYAFQILRYSKTASVLASPVPVITGPPGFPATALAIDSSGRFYVAVSEFSAGTKVGLRVLVFNSGAQGAATPIHTVKLPYPGGATFVTAMTVDAQNSIYLCIGGDQAEGFANVIYVFVQNPHGDYVVSKSIFGSLITTVYQMAVGPVGQLYVANGWTGSVLVFDPAATGNATPAQIPAPDPSLSGPEGVAVDSAGNVYAAYHTNDMYRANLQPYLFIPSQAVVYVYPPGSATPTRSKTVSTSHQYIAGVSDVAVDTNGDIYFRVGGYTTFLGIFRNGSLAFQTDGHQYGLALY